MGQYPPLEEVLFFFFLAKVYSKGATLSVQRGGHLQAPHPQGIIGSAPSGWVCLNPDLGFFSCQHQYGNCFTRPRATPPPPSSILVQNLVV